MKDDELLRALAQVARRDSEAERSPRWERLASGEATEDEKRELEAIALGEEEADAIAAMAPMGDAVAARVMARLAAAKPSPKMPSPEMPSPKMPSPKMKVARFPRAALVVGGIAIAAGVAFIASRELPHASPLPAYAMVATGGLRESRGAPASNDSPMRLGRESQLSLVLRPARDVTTALDVRAAIVRGARIDPWRPPVSISPTGVVTIAGPSAAIVPGPPGACVLVVVVGPRGALPSDDAAIARAVSGPTLAVGRAEVELIDR